MKPSAMTKNWQLKTERKQQGWTQAKLANALGVTSRTVLRWEQGLSVPQPNYRRILSTLFGKTAQELGLLQDADKNKGREQALFPVAQAATTKASLLADSAIQQPQSPVGGLVGRTDLFMKVKERLLEADSLTFTGLYGLPGIGKTTLAVALANDQEVQARFRDGILWASLGPLPHTLGQLIRWGTLLGVTPNDVDNPESCEAWSRTLRSAIGSQRILLVIDDAWTIADVLALQIGGTECTFLVTTRQPHIAFAFSPLRSIVVPQLEVADGLTLLTRFIPQLVQQDPEGARSLVQTVNGLPLALTLIGNYLASSIFSGQPWPLRVVLAQLHNSEKHLHLSMLVTPKQNWPNLTKQVPLSLYATIALCTQQLSPQAQATLCALAIFPPKPHSFSEEAALVISQQPRETLDELWDAGLLENWGSGRYTLHQIVATYARAWTKTTATGQPSR